MGAWLAHHHTFIGLRIESNRNILVTTFLPFRCHFLNEHLIDFTFLPAGDVGVDLIHRGDSSQHGQDTKTGCPVGRLVDSQTTGTLTLWFMSHWYIMGRNIVSVNLCPTMQKCILLRYKLLAKLVGNSILIVSVLILLNGTYIHPTIITMLSFVHYNGRGSFFVG